MFNKCKQLPYVISAFIYPNRMNLMVCHSRCQHAVTNVILAYLILSSAFIWFLTLPLDLTLPFPRDINEPWSLCLSLSLSWCHSRSRTLIVPKISALCNCSTSLPTLYRLLLPFLHGVTEWFIWDKLVDGEGIACTAWTTTSVRKGSADAWQCMGFARSYAHIYSKMPRSFKGGVNNRIVYVCTIELGW
jgi:hypothetical protein